MIWCPKFHCEHNPIEGLKCDFKRYLRKHNTQEFYQLLGLIQKSIIDYKEYVFHVKLWNRFWEAKPVLWSVFQKNWHKTQKKKQLINSKILSFF